MGLVLICYEISVNGGIIASGDAYVPMDYVSRANLEKARDAVLMNYIKTRQQLGSVADLVRGCKVAFRSVTRLEG